MMMKCRSSLLFPVLAFWSCCFWGLTTATTTTTTTTALRAADGGFWPWYKSLLKSRPIPTKAVTAATLMCSAEILSQVLKDTLEQQQKQFDDNSSSSSSSSSSSLLQRLNFRSAAEVSLVGLMWSGPAAHTWYQILDHIINIQHEVLRLVAMLVLDSIVFGPVTISVYFVLRSILEGKGLEGAKYKLQTKFWKTLLASYRLWPAANTINFALVPLPFRVLYMNVVSMLWSGYLAFVNASK